MFSSYKFLFYFLYYFIRQLCVLLNAEDIYRTLAQILLEEPNLKFASLMVEQLNMILLTSSELYELRTGLKDLNTKVSINVFILNILITVYSFKIHCTIYYWCLCHSYKPCFFRGINIIVNIIILYVLNAINHNNNNNWKVLFLYFYNG